MGGGLFSMHFGAACLLYPVTWGADAGSAVWAAFAGVFLSGILLPCFGYIALVRGRGDFLDIIRRAAPAFGLMFVVVLILVLGPFFMIPRITAALWAGIVQLCGWKSAGGGAALAFNVVVYTLTFFFVSNQGKVVERVGKVLFPILLCIVAAVIAQSIAVPLAARVPPVFSENPVVHGFLSAYAAGDLQCALVYGVVLVHGIAAAGVPRERTGGTLLKISVIGLGLLALAHLGHMIAGANTGGTIHLTLAALYVQMVIEMWGSAGGVVFIAALATASLTATIGLTSSTAALWEKILDARAPYRRVCLFTCVLACVVSTTGIDAIVTFLGPFIDACYPTTIVIAVYYCFCPDPLARRGLAALRWAMIASAFMGAAGVFRVYDGLLGLNARAFERLWDALPLSAWSLCWVPVAAVVFAAAWFFARKE